MRVRAAIHPEAVLRIAQLKALGIVRQPVRSGRSLGLPPRWRVKCGSCHRFRIVCGYPKEMVRRAAKGMRCQPCAGERRVTTGVIRTTPGTRKRRVQCPKCRRSRSVTCTLAWVRERHMCRVCGQRARRNTEARFCAALDAVF